MIIDDIKDLNKEINDYNLDKKIVSYNENTKSEFINVIYSENNNLEIGKLKKSEYNVSSLARKIEKQALIEKEIALKTYKIGNKINEIAILSLLFLNLCQIGNIDLILIILNIISVSMISYQEKILIDKLNLENYKQELINKLKYEKIYLEEDEINSLNILSKIRYELDGEVTIANFNEVCSSKVLKKRIKK